MRSRHNLHHCTLLALAAASIGCAGETEKDEPTADCTPVTWYRDVDGDGHGDASGPYEACEAPAGHVSGALDCNDQDPGISPDASESCNGVDDNCDGSVDEGVDGGSDTFFADTDGDGYGDPEVSATACAEPSGYVSNDLDCDDLDPTVNPEGVDEPRDGIDGDCDGSDATSLAERAHVGDLNLLTEADVTAFCAEYDGVVGDLQLAGGDLPAAVALDCLVEVTGDFVVSTDATTSLSMPALWWVGGELRVAGNPALTDLDVSSLRFVDGALVLLDNGVLGAPTFGALEWVGELSRVDGGVFPVLADVAGNVALADGMVLNALERVVGGLSIRDGSLLDVELPSLVSCGPVDLRSVALRSVVLDALEEAGSLALDLPALATDLSMAQLSVVSGDLEVVSGAAVVSAPRLATVAGTLDLAYAGLEDVDLQALGTVDGPVSVGGADLDTLRLEALQSVGGDLHVTCPGCAALDLDALQEVDGDLSLAMGLALEDLALAGVQSISGGFELLDAHRLRTLSMPALVDLGGDCTLSDLEYLETIEWPALSGPGGTVSVVNLPALGELDLSSLSLPELGGHVVIVDNPSLTVLDLGPLEAEAGGFTLQSSPGITELDLSGLTSIGQLHLSGAFTALDLSALRTTTGPVTLSVDTLSDLDLGALEVVGGDFEVSGEFDTFDLDALEVVGGKLSLNAVNATVVSLPVLRQVFTDFTLEVNAASAVDLSTLESVGGTALFLRATALPSLDLPLLESVGTLTFDTLGGTTSLSAASLSSATGSFEVLDCDAVTHLDGFSALETLGASLTIAENDLLDDVSGLSGITSIGSNVRIENNPSLPTAEAEALVEDDIGESNIGGGVLITGNAP